jgi:hypothetical protein
MYVVRKPAVPQWDRAGKSILSSLTLDLEKLERTTRIISLRPKASVQARDVSMETSIFGALPTIISNR